MTIRFTKGRGKPDVLACVRDDGSTTWTRLHPGLVQHDLVHYALESTMDLREAFYGLVARGIDITAFERPREERGFDLPVQAVQAEFVVGLLQTEMADGQRCEDFLGTLRVMVAEKDVPAPDWLSDADVVRVREAVQRILGQWYVLEPGAGLELSFPAPQS